VKHVFVETNWVVGVAAPAHHKLEDAEDLLRRATAGEVRLHLPAVCLTEARFTIPRKFQPRTEAKAIRTFVAWAKDIGRLTASEDEVVRRAVDMFESSVRAELNALGATLEALRSHPAIDVFSLNDAMLERAALLGASELDLEPFDQAILAAVLVRAEVLYAQGSADVFFCQRDGDLRPWDRHGSAKQHLARLYDASRVWVYEDFALAVPLRPADWPR
jgi:hypothetical protein